MKKFTIPLISLLLLATSCALTTEWTGFYYKSGNTMADPIMQDGFKDSSSCLSWARKQKELLHDQEGTYECGSNCKIQDSTYGTYICKETLD